MNVTNGASGARDFPIDLTGNGLPDWDVPIEDLEPISITMAGWRMDGIPPEQVDIAVRGGVELGAWIGHIAEETSAAHATLQAEWDIHIVACTADNQYHSLGSISHYRETAQQAAAGVSWVKGTGGRDGSKATIRRTRHWRLDERVITLEDVEPWESDYTVKALVRARAAVKIPQNPALRMSNCLPIAARFYLDVRTNHRRNGDPIDLFPESMDAPTRSAAIFAFDHYREPAATNMADLLEVLSNWNRQP